MDTSIHIGIIKYTKLLLILFLFLCILLPYYYDNRLNNTIIKFDYYILWIVGIHIWFYIINSFKIKIGFHIYFLSFILLYLTIIYLFKCKFDDTSLFFLLTMFIYAGFIIFFLGFLTLKEIIICVIFLIIGYTFNLVIGIYQAIHSNFNSLSIKGFLFNSGYYSNYLISILPLLLSTILFCYYLKNIYKYIIITLIILSTIIIVLTTSRAAILGLLMGYLFVFIKKNKIKVNTITYAYTIAIFCSLIAVLYQFRPESVHGRLNIYKVSLYIIKDNFLFGIGPNRFSAVYNNYQSSYFNNNFTPSSFFADDTFEPFNIILLVLIEFGVVPIIVITFLLYKTLKVNLFRANKITKWLHVGSSGSILAIFISGLFSNPLHSTPIQLLFIFHIAIYLKGYSAFLGDIRIKYQLNILLIALLLYFLYYINIRNISENNWYFASENAKYGNYEKSKNIYKSLFPMFKHNGAFLFNFGAEACLANDVNNSINILTLAKKYFSSSTLYLYLGDAYANKGDYKNAEIYYLQAINVTPSYFFPRYKLILLYKKYKQFKKYNYWKLSLFQCRLKDNNPGFKRLISEL